MREFALQGWLFLCVEIIRIHEFIRKIMNFYMVGAIKKKICQEQCLISVNSNILLQKFAKRNAVRKCKALQLLRHVLF